MPSSITHLYIGTDTIKKLNNHPQNILTKNINNFKIYCQGTDVLYFYHIFLFKSNKFQKLGHEFHRERTFLTFDYLINLNKQNKNEELFTFISGLITHYKADSIMHPYINYLAHDENKLKHLNNHFRIETYIDNYFTSIRETINQKKFKHYQILFNYTKEPIIVDTLNKLFKHFYNVDNIGNVYFQALKEMAIAFKYVRYDSTGIKKRLYKIIDYNRLPIRRTNYLSYNFELDNNTYYLNLDNKTWFNYKDKKITSNKSFLELYDQVINESSNIINQLYEYIFEDKNIKLKKLIGNYSYSTGLLLKD